MAGGQKRKKMTNFRNGRKVDRISELPVNIKEQILGYLQIKNAVATCVLSSEWRYCWTGLRKLVFDRRFWDGVNISKVLERSRIIDRVLLLHSGPVHEFFLTIPESEDQSLDIAFWLLVLSKKGVKKIYIDAILPVGELFTMPSCLFNCHELEELSLFDFNFKLTLPRDFKGFPNLRSLEIGYSETETIVLERLISGCRLLETLSFVCLDLDTRLTLEARNLKTFNFDGYKNELEKIIFKDVPKLTNVSFSRPLGNDLERLCSIHWIQELTLDIWWLKDLTKSIPERIFTPLKSLKRLTLKYVNPSRADHIQFTFFLVRCAPNMQKLIIELNSDDWHGHIEKSKRAAAAKLLQSEAKKGTRYKSIQTIIIKETEEFLYEYLLITTLQECCPNAVIVKYR